MTDELGPGVEGMRRSTWWFLIAIAAASAVFPALTLINVGVLTRMHAIALVVLLVIATAVQLRLVVDAVREPYAGWRRPVEAAAGWLAAVLAWSLAAPVEDLRLWLLVPVTITGALVITARRRHRWPVTVAATVLVAAAGVVGAVAADPSSMPVPQGVGAIIAVPAFCASDVLQIWVWEVTLRLDRARRVGADLAVARERLRFAADLHDLQGHHLQVIALKGELVSRLIDTGTDTDAAAARAQADELAAIARTALAETRDIVQGYRQADLRTEVSNAVRILAAAGIDTEVTGDPGAVPAPWQPLFGVLVREGTTNVLRHSEASHCAVHLDAATVHVCNDGVTGPDSADGGSGLAGLRERFVAAGGEVEAGATAAGGFRLVGRIS